jgi:hypothetical protein
MVDTKVLLRPLSDSVYNRCTVWHVSTKKTAGQEKAKDSTRGSIDWHAFKSGLQGVLGFYFGEELIGQVRHHVGDDGLALEMGIDHGKNLAGIGFNAAQGDLQVRSAVDHAAGEDDAGGGQATHPQLHLGIGQAGGAQSDFAHQTVQQVALHDFNPALAWNQSLRVSMVWGSEAMGLALLSSSTA